MEFVLQPLILRRVRHSRMLLAGIQAEFGLDPRLKHSGVTVLGIASLDPSQIFKAGTKDTKIFVGCALRTGQLVTRMQRGGIRDAAAGEICADRENFPPSYYEVQKY